MADLASRPAVRTRPCSCPEPLPCECSYVTLLRARARAAGRFAAGEPLLRNGHLLAASSVLAAGLGAVFWIFATRWYSADTVGRSSAALSAVALLSVIGQFNLGDVLVRFVPGAGRHTRRLVLRCYAVSAVGSAVAAIGFLLLLPWIAPKLGYLRGPLVAGAFVAATVGYSLFVLQDSALTGLRRAGWVLGENALFAVAKAAVLAICAALAVGAGILLSWSVALVVSIAVTSVVLFRWAIPAHQRADRAGAPRPDRVMRFAAADYLGMLFSLGPYTVVSLLVLDRLGAAQNAYFSLTWLISYPCYLAALGMGNSLVVEAAHAPERLAEHGRRVLRHTAFLVAVATVVLVVVAPWVLSLFGAQYAQHGTTVLRLMALGALPNVLPTVAVDVARARRALPWVIGLQVAYAVLAVGMVGLFLPLFGLTGVAMAMLFAHCALALPLLLALPRWLPKPARRLG
ncbi:hypothetical protein [Kitasatospora sp. MAP5-34]|uniref:lipopolysaccharide biosynthesis protein n=1 Tax=Kitasatospora sp. MAP5-34 TaxID=3035102 RepID=UPI00247508B7|nr:hypothetical protein [Kitasatospora sp. MAP5-34]MDH6575133.1 O-antigen/teichoic acid export membrane protein [Kitasatospora sp. MAP5-34]